MVRRGKQLFVGDHPLAPGGVRAGDRISFRLEDGMAYASEIVAFSERLLTGVLQRQGRYPYVEGIGEDRGRIGLTQPPATGSHGDVVTVKITGRDRRGLMGYVVDNLSNEQGNVLDQAIAAALSAFELPHEWPEGVTA